MKRVFLIVLDSVGAGYAKDAAAFGDEGANTLLSVHKTGRLNIPNLLRMGLGNVPGLGFLGEESAPLASCALLGEKSPGKDTTTGHWEMAGVVLEKPFPTYPEGFPEEIISEFSRRTERGVLCNKPYSGTDAVRDYGDEHVKSGKFIVYTSSDSVFQIAAHEETVPLEELYKACRTAREILKGSHAVGRVIARPFEGESGSYRRTASRRDFSLPPAGKTMLDEISREKSVIAVGKIGDIFASRGVTRSIITHSNAEGEEATINLAESDFEGLCFVNLVDFDTLYGHRNDPIGYAEALNEFDTRLPAILERLRADDALLITADHGCDPSFPGTDHTRENVPLLIYSKSHPAQNLGFKLGFDNIAATVCDMLGVNFSCGEEGFYDKL